jgi:hypothetical protein
LTRVDLNRLEFRSNLVGNYLHYSIIYAEGKVKMYRRWNLRATNKGIRTRRPNRVVSRPRISHTADWRCNIEKRFTARNLHRGSGHARKCAYNAQISQ